MNPLSIIVFSVFFVSFSTASVSDIITLAQKALNGTGLTPAQITDFVTNVSAASPADRQQAINNYVNSITDPTVQAAVKARVNEIEGIISGLHTLADNVLAVLAQYNISNATVAQIATDVNNTYQSTHNFTAVQQVVVADINKAVGNGNQDNLRAALANVFQQYAQENPSIVQRIKSWFSNLFG